MTDASTVTLRRLRPLHDQCCYVRFRELRSDGFVEFDFSVGDPDLSVELILPEAAYRAFCEANDVIQVDAEQAAAIDHDAAKWRYGQPGITE